MDYRINTKNEKYIMIYKFDIYLMISNLTSKDNLTKEEKNILKILEKITSCIFNYKNKYGKHKVISEIAIDKNSILGDYIISTNELERKNITLNETINAMLACIEKDELEYYDKLTETIKIFKNLNRSEIDYMNFKNIIGIPMTNYIIKNSKRMPNTYEPSQRVVYLYENNQISLIDLEEEKQNKTKTRTIN